VIEFRARLHPRRRVVEISATEQRALHADRRDSTAIKTTITQATQAHGRDTERDLYNEPGRYVRLLDSRMVGQPCPGDRDGRACATPIEKISHLGGASYLCPRCQT
jgi:formamidopyrimidine-DNA glycosylase